MPTPNAHATEMELLVGKEVFELLSDENFLASWSDLYHTCSWSTPYQSKEYVCSWYQLYGENYLPIIVKTQKEGKLTGLLTLALPSNQAKRGKKKIVAAGHFDADYQTWLAREADGEAFIQAAILALWKRFPKHDVALKYIPTQTPLSWIKSTSFWEQRCTLVSFTRPLMDLKEADVSKRTKKRINQIKKLATFERLTDFERFSTLLDGQIGHLYDFRRGALFNKNPFRDDPSNKQLLLSLFSKGILHVTVLKVHEEIIASVAVMLGKDRAFLGGINCHSPLYADYSPGYLHFILLGQQLAVEGFDLFDLTPGYDPYKERLATNHEEVHQLVITKSRRSYVKSRIGKWVHNRLIRTGIRPMSMQVEMKKRLYLLRHHGWYAMLSGKIKSLAQKDQQKLYILDSRLTNPTASIVIRKNSLGDLLSFEQQNKKLTRWEFLATAMRRFEQGEHCYTWTEDSRLLGCAWLAGTTALLQDTGEGGIASGVCLNGIYCHSAGKDKITSFLKATITAVTADRDEEHIYVLATDVSLYEPLEAIGFRDLGKKALPSMEFSFYRPLASNQG
ncbi:MAG TPA: GNAT family N-acetyltransferase [Flavisolibacter sp.]|nr:GNAT family N-acetyltransferase [Flavisolibacter sp.]